MATLQTYNDAEVLNIAKRQKAIIWLILISILLNIVALMAPWFGIALLGVSILSLLYIYRLAAALKESAPWLYVIGGIIPCVGLITLLVLNGRATAALKTRGVRVGLLGARGDDLEKLSSEAA